jgi:hypothetical protein
VAIALYWTVQLASIADPTNVQIKDGLDGTGAALPATQKGSEPYTTGGVYTEATQVVGLVAGTNYDLNWVAYDDVALTYSAIAKTIFTTTAIPAVVGGMATSELLDQIAVTGKRTYFGAFAVTEVRDTAAFAGTVIPKFHVGTLAGVETQLDTFAAAGTVGPPTGRSGDLLAVEQRDTAAFAGSKTHFGTVLATEARDIAAFSGVQIPSFSSGTLAVEEARDTFAATGAATTGIPVNGGLVATEARDAAAFAGARTYFGTMTAAERRDNAAFAGFIIKFITGTLAALETRDVAQFDAEPRTSRNNVVLRDANVGLNVSPQQQWRDGAPSNPDGTLLPTRLGHENVVNNLTNRGDANRRQVRLLQAPQDTQAQTDIVTGWYAYIPVVAGEWVWCISRDNIVDDADNPIGQDDVVV